MEHLNIIQQLAVWALPVLFGITVHEAAHGWMAKQLGDPTALLLGRLSLNPIKHIDPLGTVVIPLSLFVLGSLAGTIFLFGWAKPVPVQCANFKKPKRDLALVAAAGPVANLLMALIWGFIMKMGYLLSDDETAFAGIPLLFMGFAGITINSVLLVLNLLPLPPLDGGRILVGLLPSPFSDWVARLESYGMMILIFLLASGILGRIMTPLADWVQYLIIFLLHL